VIFAGFYALYNLPEYYGLSQKMIGLGNLFLFFVIMPVFIIARYSKKDLSSFTFNNRKDDDEDWDDEEKK
jgi:hypothetical protein